MENMYRYIYLLDTWEGELIEIDNELDEEPEDLIISKGYSLENVNWMCSGKKLNIKSI